MPSVSIATAPTTTTKSTHAKTASAESANFPFFHLPFHPSNPNKKKTKKRENYYVHDSAKQQISFIFCSICLYCFSRNNLRRCSVETEIICWTINRISSIQSAFLFQLEVNQKPLRRTATSNNKPDICWPPFFISNHKAFSRLVGCITPISIMCTNVFI